jgi:phosphatidylglycerol---prolipoprotein diacylglyceryl transferase
VKPIPVVFHIGALQIHTYGIGLAITFWVSYRYFARRLRAHGYEDAWFGSAFVWIIVASIVGARAVHVIANWGYYSRNLGDIVAVWHGGLTSWGGLALGVPMGLYLAHRWCKPLRLVVALDLVGPVLLLAWAIGRLLGPQLMVGGGGYPTHQWFGMEYAGQVGKRLPVPLFQSIECLVAYFVALAVERFVARRGGPLGVVISASATLYGMTRLFDESILLPHGPAGTWVEGVSIGLVVFGVGFVPWLMWRDRAGARQRALEGEAPSDPWANPEAPAATGSPDEGDGGDHGEEDRVDPEVDGTRVPESAREDEGTVAAGGDGSGDEDAGDEGSLLPEGSDPRLDSDEVPRGLRGPRVT